MQYQPVTGDALTRYNQLMQAIAYAKGQTIPEAASIDSGLSGVATQQNNIVANPSLSNPSAPPSTGFDWGTISSLDAKAQAQYDQTNARYGTLTGEPIGQTIGHDSPALQRLQQEQQAAYSGNQSLFDQLYNASGGG